ncbi:hypothetical protein EXIGLDRAFT_713919 [Exidia glandulosa HHB12029]|uniref:DNA-directed RNA polymerase III subunit RPC9 n=1 Tax=Exidia glandulosa HHB12029 TaxID=1314781 RepID=A0A165BWI2_EXIGL|nr:hypothetical protein EXIGLDRAFT_713919 [Exidia glandulosa HHB12029]
MEVVNARAALLSNYEVLQLLKEHEAEQLAHAKAAFAVKKEHGTDLNAALPTDEVIENLRTVEFEAIEYLSAPFQPTAQQSAEGISKLVRSLAPESLTKAEKLQIANLAPTEPIELYVIVEELEERMLDKMDDILQRVKDSLDDSANANADGAPRVVTEAELAALAMDIDGDNGWDKDGNDDEPEYVDDEGAFEGDLDLDDD